MAYDIYFKIPTDPNYDPNQIEVSDDHFAFYQEIEHCLTARKTEVLGDPNFGADLDSYLWSKASAREIESDLNAQIAEYCPEYIGKIPYSVEVSFFKGDIYDSILVDIFIDQTKVLGIKVQ